jgi:hypothetical protein
VRESHAAHVLRIAKTNAHVKARVDAAPATSFASRASGCHLRLVWSTANSRAVFSCSTVIAKQNASATVARQCHVHPAQNARHQNKVQHKVAVRKEEFLQHTRSPAFACCHRSPAVVHFCHCRRVVITSSFEHDYSFLFYGMAINVQCSAV